MNRLIILALLLVMGISTYSQKCKDEIIEKMNQLEITDSSNRKVMFHFNEVSGSLIFNGLQIPVTDEVIMETKRVGKTNTVMFFFQNGKSISRLENPSWRRAYFELTNIAKSDAIEFIKLYQSLNTQL